MRGCGTPKRRRKSACTMRSTPSTPSLEMALGTSASARWVVASATRRPPPTSIITTCGVFARAARYSVWPVKGTPASLMTLFCTGAVTMASNSPDRQPSMARSSTRSTYGPLAGSSRPGVAGCASATCSTCGALKSERSPITTRRAPRSMPATFAQSSGPMPAGSPEVSAMTGTASVLPAAGRRRSGRATGAATAGSSPRTCARAAPGAPAGGGAPG